MTCFDRYIWISSPSHATCLHIWPLRGSFCLLLLLPSLKAFTWSSLRMQGYPVTDSRSGTQVAQLLSEWWMIGPLWLAVSWPLNAPTHEDKHDLNPSDGKTHAYTHTQSHPYLWGSPWLAVRRRRPRFGPAGPGATAWSVFEVARSDMCWSEWT